MIKKLKAYTDGSCSTNTRKGGWGFVILENDEKVFEDKGAEEDTTNNRMELSSFLKALLYATKGEDKIENCEITIYTDSAYICNCFQDGWWKKWLLNGWKSANRMPIKNQDLWKEIINIYRKNQISIEVQKVKAHTDDYWNNYVDALATDWRK